MASGNKDERVLKRNRSRRALENLYPIVGPWTEAALWCGAANRVVPLTPLAADLDSIETQRLSTLAIELIRISGADVEPAAAEALQTDSFRRVVSLHRIAIRGAEAVELLRTSGIDCVVSKGPGIAQYYPRTVDRPFGDIDILVGPADFGTALKVLATHGYDEEAGSRPPWAYFNRHCREAVNLRSPDGGSVDLHHHVPPWYWATKGLPTEMLVQTATRFSVYGVELPCLPPEYNLLVSALHIVSDRNQPGRTLLAWRDVYELARVVDPVHMAETAARASMSGWLEAILRALPSDLQPRDLIRQLSSQSSHIAGDLRLRLLLRIQDDHKTIIMSQFLRLPLASGIPYLAGSLFPSRSFIRAHRRQGLRHPYWHWWRGE
jgi:hypothetical protein